MHCPPYIYSQFPTPHTPHPTPYTLLLIVGWVKTPLCSGVVLDHRILPTTAHKFLTIAILIQTLLKNPLLVGSAYKSYPLLI
ncbi:hypothetical protein [Moorena sp. SIO3H5]|uniref:hypothetical protein n=1 Tax=Moorena sp. SIO3H5 TaxID=2607834 RepID=UPI0013BAEE90|nr:hypothetical protein [Moorena sp. SIO3H5]NEO74048.1 hypothetical protein [Moorena sp. SIO3H5]